MHNVLIPFTCTGIWLLLYSVTWKSDENVAVARVLTKEVKSLNPTFQAGDIRGTVYNITTSIVIFIT